MSEIYTDYAIIKGNSIEKLTEQVREKMNNNWQPLGGVSVKPVSTGENYFTTAVYLQAMGQLSEDYNEIVNI